MENQTKEKLYSDKNFNTEPLFPISTLANILKVHQRTLRIYDKEGLLVPTRKKGSSRRCYSLNDIEKGKLICFLTRNLALNLNSVKIVFVFIEYGNVEAQQANIKKTSKRGRYTTKKSA